MQDTLWIWNQSQFIPNSPKHRGMYEVYLRANSEEEVFRTWSKKEVLIEDLVSGFCIAGKREHVKCKALHAGIRYSVKYLCSP